MMGEVSPLYPLGAPVPRPKSKKVVKKMSKRVVETDADAARDFCITNCYLFRGEITPLSSSYNISGLVPVCLLLFQCF